MRRGESFRVLSWAWDVDAMNERLDRALEQDERLIRTRTENLKGGMYGFVALDEASLDSLENPDRPIIVLGYRLENGTEAKFVADGNHRLERALRAGQELITLMYIPPDDEPGYRL